MRLTAHSVVTTGTHHEKSQLTLVALFVVVFVCLFVAKEISALLESSFKVRPNEVFSVLLRVPRLLRHNVAAAVCVCLFVCVVVAPGRVAVRG